MRQLQDVSHHRTTLTLDKHPHPSKFWSSNPSVWTP